jgi:two-component system, NtrC family, response regulator AtoC
LYTSDHLPPEEVIFGNSEAMRLLSEKLPKIANSSVPVLILGESGTGKEVFARLIHQWSDRHRRPLVKVCCPAIPTSLLETELFGYERGAFTGAYGTKRGRIELAAEGTLFLDEIGDLDSSLQAKLLRLLQDGTFCRVGGEGERRINIRLLTATNRDLRTETDSGHFRIDLFHRINAFTIELPPLRQRTTDLPALIDHFLRIYAAKFSQPIMPLSSNTIKLLERHIWPGNIRELENMIRSYVVMGDEEAILDGLVTDKRGRINAEIEFDSSLSLKQITKRAVQDLEYQIILKVLQANDWNRKRTSETLKISYRSLLYKMREAGFNAGAADDGGDELQEGQGFTRAVAQIEKTPAVTPPKTYRGTSHGSSHRASCPDRNVHLTQSG